jgi:transposase
LFVPRNEVNTEALRQIGELYAIEAASRGKPPDERRRVRQEQARPLLDVFEIWLRSTLGTVSQKGDTAKAINYALNQWAALTLYVDDGAVEIDNNAAERALRAVATGRSLCTSLRNLGKHWKLPFNVVATRAMFARQRSCNCLTA